MVMGYTNTYFVKLMDRLYVRYGQITPGDLMQNQEYMHTMYNVKYPIDILFDQIKTGQEFAVAGNSPFLITIWQTWASQKFCRCKNIHMHLARGRVSRQIIRREYGSSLISRNPTWTDKTSSRSMERQAMEVTTTSSTDRWRMPS